jgi:hypothetical protein
MRTHRFAEMEGDRYAGEWPAEHFRAHHINFVNKSKSDLYRDLLPVHRIDLLDVRRSLRLPAHGQSRA